MAETTSPDPRSSPSGCGCGGSPGVTPALIALYASDRGSPGRRRRSRIRIRPAAAEAFVERSLSPAATEASLGARHRRRRRERADRDDRAEPARRRRRRDRLLGGAGLLEHRLRQRGGRGRRRLRRRSGLGALVAEVFQDNPASARVLTRAGFDYEGEGEIYSLARGGMVPTFRYRRRLGDAAMKFLDHARVDIRSGGGGARLRQLPAREVRRVRRPRRRRRRQGRRRLGRGGRRAEHADRLPLPAAFLREERPARHGQAAHRQERPTTSCCGCRSAPRSSRRTARRWSPT